MPQIFLISPPLVAYDRDIFGMIPSPPIGLASIAAYLREQGFTVGFLDAFGEKPFNWFHYRDSFVKVGLTIDEIIERIDSDVNLVGISVHSGMVSSLCIELAANIKKMLGKKVVVGGPHVTLNYCDFLQEGVDYAVIGEGEAAMAALLKKLADGNETIFIPGIVDRKRMDNFIQSVPVEMDTLPIPAWDLVPLENYWELKMNHSPFKGRFAPIITSRGCSYNCKFCSTPLTSGRQWRGHSPQRVVDDLQYLIENYGIEDIFIQDDNFTLKPDRVKDICRLILERGLRVRLSLPSGVRVETLSEDLIPSLSESGLNYLCLAPESGSRRIRKQMSKPLDEKKLYRIQRVCRKVGIKSGVFFIIGFPGETFSDILKTAGMIAKLIFLGVDDISIFIYSPLPGKQVPPEFMENFPRDYLGICWSPRWRKDFRKLSWIRILLYLEYSILKILFQPLSIPKHIRNIVTKKFETKGEMGAARFIAAFLRKKKI